VLLAPTVTLPKPRVVRFGVSDAAVPVPVRPTRVVLPAVPPLLEVMVSVSLVSPAASGAYWINTWALPPGRMLLVDDRTVKPEPPATVMPVIVREDLPVLLMVRLWVALPPMDTVPKPMVAGLTPITGTATPVPVNVMVVTAPPTLAIARLLGAATPFELGE
jgi:hypothetical protein